MFGDFAVSFNGNPGRGRLKPHSRAGSQEPARDVTRPAKPSAPPREEPRESSNAMPDALWPLDATDVLSSESWKCDIHCWKWEPGYVPKTFVVILWSNLLPINRSICDA